MDAFFIKFSKLNELAIFKIADHFSLGWRCENFLDFFAHRLVFFGLNQLAQLLTERASID